MRKIRVSIFVVASMLCMMACVNKNESEKQPAASEQSAEPETEAVSEDNNAKSEIIGIQKAWKSKTIDVDSGDITAGIEQFALAFCEEFAAYEPNKTLYDYLIDPKSYDLGEKGYSIDVQKSYGFISCHKMTQFNENLDCCYWKCNDGKCLVGFWLDEGFEDEDKSTKALLFYDYDPATDVMTPKPELTARFEKFFSTCEDYNVELPMKGKDIVVTKFTAADDDSYDSVEKVMKWNGKDFDIK